MMTAKERILNSCNHIQPDKLAVDFGAMRSTGIHIVAYNALLKELGVAENPKLYDVYQQLAEPSAEVLNVLGGDVVQVHRLSPAFGITLDEWKEMRIFDSIDALVPRGYNPVADTLGGLSILSDGKVIAQMPKGGYYFDSVYSPLAAAQSPDDLRDFTPAQVTEKELQFIEAQADAYRESGKAVLFAFGGNVLEAGEGDFGFANFMELLLCEPELVNAYFEKITEAYLFNLDKILKRIGSKIDIVQFGDDLGSQSSTLISPQVYREMIKPYHKTIYGFVRKNYPKLKVFLHSCGAIAPLIPDLIDAGVQILNPVQITASGMNPKDLKSEFGNDLVFWGGGARMQTTVMGGDIEKIKRETHELIDIFAPGGGFVFCQVHNIQAGVSPEKIIAIYQTARK